MQCNDIQELTSVLRQNGDKILDASSKLSLSTTLLCKMNESFKNIFGNKDVYSSTFSVLNSGSNIIDQFLDLQLLYDFVQKTLALKILPDHKSVNTSPVDINLFHNLKLLEVHRFSLNLINGLKNLRAQLQYLTCMRSVNTLEEVLEKCGADRTQGYVWNELKEAVFSHNGLSSLDTSLEFVPGLLSIDLSHNQINDVQSLNCLSNLKYLNLGFNQIQIVPAFTGPLCNKLQVLILRNNYIDDIKELSVLVNLQELDISNNCLIEHSSLIALSNLSCLRGLKLQGNPLCYHPHHRNRTAMYLHINVSADFLLENSPLSRSELRFVGSMHRTSLERTPSCYSITTTSTIVPNDRVRADSQQLVLDINITSDMEVSAGSNVSNDPQNQTEGFWIRNEAPVQDGQGMQDSGFVAGPRPASPSECSIGSATSLENDNGPSTRTIKYCESDIEILSNPSQSSIEILSNRSAPRYVQSASAILSPPVREISTNSDLRKSANEMHRSL